MKFIRGKSIQGKLTRIIVLTSTVSLAIALVSVTVIDIYSFRKEMVENAVLISRVVGDYSVTELAFNNREESSMSLARLGAIPHIMAAAIYDGSGDIFSSYVRNGTGDALPTGSRNVKAVTVYFSSDSLNIVNPILHDDYRYGTIYIRVSNTPLFLKIGKHLAMIVIMGAVVIAISFFFASKFQRVVSDPIMKLSEATRDISKKGDYSIRVLKSGDDEIGMLCDGFNDMLDQIQNRQSERDRALMALKRSEARFRNMIEQSSDPLFVLKNLRLVFVNPRFVDYLNYTEEEILAGDFNLLDLISPEMHVRVSNLIRRKQRGDKLPNQHDLRGITRDGRIIDFEVNFSFIEWDGQPAVLGMLRDITARKLAEEELRMKQEELARTRIYLQNLIDSMPSLLIGIDSDDGITQWNQEVERVTGIPATEALGKNAYELYPLLSAHKRMINGALHDKIPHKSERIVNTGVESISYLDLMVYPLAGESIGGAVIRIDDVTSRVKMEQIMLQTEKMMSVGGLAAGMAHEINNPLGGILLGAQNIFRRISPDFDKNLIIAREMGISMEDVHRYMEKRGILDIITGIQEMGERASGIVENMLNFSRRSENKLIKVDLAELIDRTLALAANDYDLKKKYDFRHIELIREYEEGLPGVPCFSQEIEQVILNIVKNAAHALSGVRFSGEERPRIILRLKNDADSARIEIEDNGPGMDQKTRARIFEPFFTTKKSGEGTGLGLSVSYYIISTNHGGRIRADNAAVRGTCFIINLPFEKA